MKPALARSAGLALAALLLSACVEMHREPATGGAQPPPPDAGVDEKIVPGTQRDAADAPPRQEAIPASEVTVAGSRVADDTRLMGKVSHDAMVYRPAVEPADRENYGHFDDNPVRLASEHPVSTLSIDVDTGAYANVRRFLNGGRLPPHDAVRVEEMINYFRYAYPAPTDTRLPFSISTELAATPWNPETLLMRVGIRGYDVPADERPPANLVFLIDVSGSMHSPDKLPLLKRAFRLLTKQLHGDDRVAIVVYAGASGVVLEPTPGNERARIMSAIGRLRAGGSTNGAAGIRLAYDLAEGEFIDGGINRVILATDGDFNVGTVNFEALVDLAERQRETGVSLTTLGFGTGNYNEHMMERIADAGNGNYAYIDTLNEARKVLVTELSSTLHTIAKDVKIQIEFNPAVVAEYRLIGYENRVLNREDFNNDKVDAGEIGAGHTVTALYEIALTGSNGTRIDPLRYQQPRPEREPDGELAFVKVRFKLPDADTSRLVTQAVAHDPRRLGVTSADFRFAAAVAAFGQRLRGGSYLGDFDYPDIHRLAAEARGRDAEGYRGEFLSLVSLAESIAPASARAAR